MSLPSASIFLDESGDLGWSFQNQYRYGGSSRYLTIASLSLETSKAHLSKRLIRKLYKSFGWDPSVEKKWARMRPNERLGFARMASELVASNTTDVRCLSITVRKDNVMEHIRSDPNKLYNYMIGLSLLDEMAKHDNVFFVPDPRSIKIKSGNSLHDYLQTKLWFDKKATTQLVTSPADSASNSNG